MFEKYTERARRVIFYSREEASLIGGSSIDSEHILLGLLREDLDLFRTLMPKSDLRAAAAVVIELLSRKGVITENGREIIGLSRSSSNDQSV